MKKITVLFLAVSLVSMLCACGSKTESGSTSLQAHSSGTPVIILEEYNSINSADTSDVEELREELLAAAQSCTDIYCNAEKGDALNAVLQDSAVAEMIAALGNNGYSAIDYQQRYNMSCYEAMESFCIRIAGSEDIKYTYFVVYNSGQISAYRMERKDGDWHLLTMSCEFTREGVPRIYSRGRFQMFDVKYSEKGRLMYSRSNVGFDENQKSNTVQYTFVKVNPTDAVYRSMCEKYIKPVGYFENNLFTMSWSESNFGPVDFNSLFAYLHGMYYGTESLTEYNAGQYYSPVGTTRLYCIPTETFEKITRNYFNIDTGVLKNISDYSSKLGGYMFIGYTQDYYNVTPRTPYPEVTAYTNNGDGTITLRVDAVNPWFGSDKVFTHDVRIRVYSNGKFEYVSNTLIDSEENILPEQKLAAMLDVERSKTNY